MKLGVPWPQKEKGPQRSVPHNIAELSSVHERLDDLTRQLDRLARITEGRFSQSARNRPTAPDRSAPEPVAEDPSRFEQPRQPAEEPSAADSAVIERYAGRRKLNRPALKTTYASSGPAGGGALEDAIADIAARQRALDEENRTVAPAWQRAIEDDRWGPPPRRRDVEEDRWGQAIGRPRRNPPRAASPPAPDLSGLERHLRDITEKVEALRRPCAAEDAVPAMRQELSDISRSLAEAVPQRAIEALETEIRGLAERLDQSRQSGGDGSALANLEHGLADVRAALHTLTPAENLVGFQAAIEALAGKIDSLTLAQQDPVVLQHLESAITGLRSVVAHVASDDALGRLTDEVRGLAAKIERTAADAAPAPDALKGLEQRVGAMEQAIEQSAAQGRQVPAQVETAVRGLADKIDKLERSRGDTIAVGHLEDRIAKLVEKLDASGARLNHLDSIERGLTDVLVHLEQQRSRAAAAPPPAPAPDPTVESIKRDMESVSGALTLVVDRLASIETDLRSTPRERAALAPAAVAVATPAASAPAAGPALPESAAPKDSAAPKASPPTPGAQPAPAAPAPPRLAPQQEAAPPPEAAPASPPGLSERLAAAAAAQGRPTAGASRPPIDPHLPPDHPIEPGTARSRSQASAAERIAASEAALGAAKSPAADPSSKASFIAAARRAAQTAAHAPPGGDPAGAGEGKADRRSLRQRFAGRVRSMVVGAGVVLVTLGAFRIALLLLDTSEPAAPASGHVAQTAGKTKPAQLGGGIRDPGSTGSAPKSEPAAKPPSAASSVPPAPPQSSLSPPATAPTNSMPWAMGSPWNTGSLANATDVTGSIPPAAAAGSPSAPSPADPLAHSGNDLMAAAQAGNPAAQYELAERQLSGRGSVRNPAQAATWLERAAKQGLVPAQFRLGTLYEKGVGVNKDRKAAQRLYQAAADKGNAKAMHNLAVLYSEGIDGKPDYKTAAHWFGKAAERGITDSQYNLAVLRARGVGVERNLGEAYKWFALAALKGDRKSAKKRDEVAAKLDAASLAAARLAVTRWRAVPQPKDAVTVEPPPGGWDRPAAKPTAKPPAPARHSVKRPSPPRHRAGQPLQIGPG